MYCIVFPVVIDDMQLRCKTCWRVSLRRRNENRQTTKKESLPCLKACHVVIAEAMTSHSSPPSSFQSRLLDITNQLHMSTPTTPGDV